MPQHPCSVFSVEIQEKRFSRRRKGEREKAQRGKSSRHRNSRMSFAGHAGMAWYFPFSDGTGIQGPLSWRMMVGIPLLTSGAYQMVTPGPDDSSRAPSPSSPEEPTDRSLLRRLQQGQADASTELYLRYAERLLAVAAAQTSPDLARRVDPEDIVQSVFRTFFRRASLGPLHRPRRRGDLEVAAGHRAEQGPRHRRVPPRGQARRAADLGGRGVRPGGRVGARPGRGRL